MSGADGAQAALYARITQLALSAETDELCQLVQAFISLDSDDDAEVDEPKKDWSVDSAQMLDVTELVAGDIARRGGIGFTPR